MTVPCVFKTRQGYWMDHVRFPGIGSQATQFCGTLEQAFIAEVSIQRRGTPTVVYWSGDDEKAIAQKGEWIPYSQAKQSECGPQLNDSLFTLEEIEQAKASLNI